MKIVLAHGAWHDGSLWSDVAGPLKTGGHEVYTPTLAGNRPGSIDRTIGHAEAVQSAVDYIAEAVQSAVDYIAEAVQSVVDYINKNNLSDFVLLGHSYGRSIISKIAEAMPERIRRLVYRNAFVLMDGEIGEKHELSTLQGYDGWYRRVWSLWPRCCKIAVSGLA